MAIRLQSIGLGLVASFAFTLFAGHATFAASNQSITMSPASTQINVAPGSTVSNSFTLINSGNSNFDITTSVSPYHVNGEEYDPVFTQLPGTTDVASWIKLSAPSLTVSALKVKEVPYTVTVPASTAPGGYYAVIFAQTSQLETGSGTGIIAHNRVGNILYITVKGDVQIKGSATPTPVSAVQISNQIPLGEVISNTGGVHFQSTGTFIVKSLGGNTLYNASVQNRYVLPNTKRLISSDWTPSAPIGIYSISRSASLPNTTVKTSTQWVLYIAPWFMDIIALAIALIGIAIIVRITLRRKHKKTGLR